MNYISIFNNIGVYKIVVLNKLSQTPIRFGKTLTSDIIFMLFILTAGLKIPLHHTSECQFESKVILNVN